jgi:hypothetical protein
MDPSRVRGAVVYGALCYLLILEVCSIFSLCRFFRLILFLYTQVCLDDFPSNSTLQVVNGASSFKAGDCSVMEDKKQSSSCIKLR